MNRNLILFAAILMVTMASCNKSAEPSVTTFVTSDTVFKLINNTSNPLQASLYTSIDNRNNGNAAYSCLVPAKGSYKISFSALDTTAEYCYDVHTPDYSLSNWPYGSTYLYPLFYSGHFYNLENQPLNQCAYYFLQNGNTSNWTAVDARDYNNNSIWSTLNANSRYMNLVINKNTTGSIMHKQSDGTLNSYVIYQMSSLNYADGSARITFYVTAGAGFEYSVYNSPIIPDFNYSHKWSRDTISLYDGYDYWIMARQ